MTTLDRSGPMAATLSGRRRDRIHHRLPAFLRRAAVFALIWLIVTGGTLSSLPFGLAGALLAASASMALAPQSLPRLQPAALAAFVPYFLKESLRGGSDVVRRAFHPQMPISPAMMQYDVSAMGRAERVAFALAVNLLPGTLAVRLEGGTLRLHAIDVAMPVKATLSDLDAHIAAIFGRKAAGTRAPI